nr:deca-heme c-type cytochrome [Vibrio breoganii]
MLKRFGRKLILFIVTMGFGLALAVAQAEDSGFVGSKACLDCHQQEYQQWLGSDHEMAMKHADEASVLGDFNDARFEFAGVENRFFKKGEQYWVNIQGDDGQYRDYQIKYTFGYDPLQQYMVEFEDGRVQLIPFAWDSRSKEEGGQRWFHLYPDLTPTDEFYWTNSGQNWNFMCADCHSTNLEKNYDREKDTYATTWSEINVGCEACHGKGQEHMTWANGDRSSQAAHLGFDRDLSKAVKEWVFEENMPALQPKSIHPTDQMTMCAQCHSRRTQLTEDEDHVQGNLLDRYRLSLITPELYHADGQIFDEDYVYGSFLQSKMAEKGVSCTNCHNPHTAKLEIAEEAVCSQCHLPTNFSPENHTFHDKDSEASKCTTCHMPETTYMQVDPRRDHSWQIPRPDLSTHLGTPNVCTSCHEDQTNEWASESLAKWFPNSKHQNQQHFAVAFYAAEIGYQGAEDALAYTAQDNTQRDIIRASATSRLAPYQGKNTTVALARAVKHDSELIRVSAVQGSAGFEPRDRWQILEPLLEDKVLGVRTEAASALVVYWSELNEQQKQALAKPLQEYMEIQEFNSDRGFGRTNLGNVYRAQGNYEQAIKEYKGAIAVEPYFANSYVNLADLYRVQGKEVQVFSTLEQGIKAQPNSGALRYSAALSLLRQGKNSQATQYLQQATEVEPDNAQYWYLYGLSLESTSVPQASKALDKAFRVSGNPQQLYARCEMLVKYSKDSSIEFQARQCITELEKYAPPEVIKGLRAKL